MKLKTSHPQKAVLELEHEDDASLSPIAASGLRLRHILVPVDFSECSRKAFHYAAGLARQFGADLALVHIVAVTPPPPEMIIADSAGLSAEHRHQAAKYLVAWRNESGFGRSAATIAREAASIPHEIIAVARNNHTDLIVIGNHGRTGIPRLLMGSTAEIVVRHAPCPVLVIRDREHEFVEAS